MFVIYYELLVVALSVRNIHRYTKELAAVIRY
jgi:hypothetical protein